jgi:protein-S-isoprenylcysteine O-methyltransferase Ste14
MLILQVVVFVIICAQLVIMTNNRQNKPIQQLGNEFLTRTRYLMITLQYLSVLIVLFAIINNKWMIGVIEFTLFAKCIGILLMLFGLLIRIISMKQLGKYYSTLLFTNNDHRMIKNGMYKHIRHPIYLGDLILYFGYCVALSNYFIFSFIMVAFICAYLVRIKQEERMMLRDFGDEYSEYCKSSKKIIPFIF